MRHKNRSSLRFPEFIVVSTPCRNFHIINIHCSSVRAQKHKFMAITGPCHIFLMHPGPFSCRSKTKIPNRVPFWNRVQNTSPECRAAYRTRSGMDTSPVIFLTQSQKQPQERLGALETLYRIRSCFAYGADRKKLRFADIPPIN